MASINTSKMIIAGVAAGVILFIADGLVNGVLLADQWAAYQKSIGKPSEFSGSQMGIFSAIDVGVGLMLAWVYAAIRPRFGAGPATAIRAGIATWALTSLLPGLFLIASQAMPADLMWISIGIGIIQFAIAGYVAGVLYKEAAEPAAMRRASA